MSQFSAQARLYKHAADTGSTTYKVILGPFSIANDALKGNETLITSFAATAQDGTSGNVFVIEVSDSAGANYEEQARIVIPDGGTMLMTFTGQEQVFEGLLIRKNRSWRVRYKQITAGEVSATVIGFTGATDVVNTNLA